MTIQESWESGRQSFAELSKADFDAKVRANEFAEGPLVTDQSDFMREFGPYSPHRWAFGKLRDGSLVQTQVC